MCSNGPKKRALLSLLLLAVVVCCGHVALHAQATLLLEEPYSYDGAFAGTGHSAVYLARVCAASPVVLRRCGPGERGAVISRYHGIAGYDWMAIPYIPYLYAVERADQIPLYADTKLVGFLREKYLAQVKGALPEVAIDSTPRAPWYELAGSAYDRTLYGFQFETTPEQDDALILKLNSAPNREAYNLVKRNCADFVREIINFYYPKAVHRSVVEDLGVTTPKQAAKTLVRYSMRHPGMQLSSYIVPQVPGTKRSKPLHGVLDSVLMAKKYMMPLMLLHPLMAGGAEVAYLAAWRFQPSRDALVFDPAGEMESPLQASQRRRYQELLRAMKRDQLEGAPSAKEWPRLQAAAEAALDDSGRPILQMTAPDGEGTIEVGLCRDNVLQTGAPPELIQQLLVSRLQSQLERSRTARTSESTLAADWDLLQTLVLQSQRAHGQAEAEPAPTPAGMQFQHVSRH